MATLEELQSIRAKLDEPSASVGSSNPALGTDTGDAPSIAGAGTFPAVQGMGDEAATYNPQNTQAFVDAVNSHSNPRMIDAAQQAVDQQTPALRSQFPNSHDPDFVRNNVNDIPNTDTLKTQFPNSHDPDFEASTENKPVTLDKLSELRAQADKIAPTEQPSGLPGLLRPTSEQAKDEVPQRYTESKGPFYDFLTGTATSINKGLADVMGFPEAAVTGLVNAVGSVTRLDQVAPKFFSANPNDALTMWEKRFDKIGLYTGAPYESLAKEYGDEAAKGILTTALMMSGVGMGAKATEGGTGVTARVLNWFNKALIEHPSLALLQGATGAVGAKAAAELTGNPWMALPGSFAGGLVGTLGVKTAMAPVRMAQFTARKTLPEGMQEVLPDVILNRQPSNLGIRPNSPLRDVLAQPERATNFAEDQVVGAKALQEQEVRNAITSIRKMDPAASQEQVTQYIKDAEEASNRVVSDYWNRVPLKAPVPTGGLRQRLADLDASIQEKDPSSTPTGEGGKNLIDDARALSTPTRGDNGRFVPAAPTVERMRGFLGEVRRASKLEEASIAPNDAKIRNYARLRAEVEKAIGDALPNDTTIAQARAVSTMHHDLFSRGNVADFLASKARGDTRFRPDQSIDMLMGRHQGLQDLTDIPQGVRNYGAPDQLTSSGHNALTNLTPEAENAVRGMFRQAADESGMDPKVALKWIDTHAHDIKALAGVSTELEGVGNQLRGLIEHGKTITTSALARFAEMDPQKAMQRIWNSANPEANAKELMRSFRTDPDALEGFRAQVIDEFLSRSKGQPQKMAELLADPKNNRLLNAALPPDHMTRLERMVSVANKLEQGDQHSFATHFGPVATIMGKILGAGIGRHLTKLSGSEGTLQGPALMSKIVSDKVGKFFSGYDAKAILSKAIQDPKWEQFLLSREPTDTKSLARLAAQVRMLVRTEQGTRETASAHLRARTQEPPSNQDSANVY